VQATRGHEAHSGLLSFIDAGGVEITVDLLGQIPAEDFSICGPVVSILAAAVQDEQILRCAS